MRSHTTHILKASLRNRALVQPPVFIRPQSIYTRKTPRLTTGAKALRAAPSIPFFGAFFSSSSKGEESGNMSYPDQRSEDQWKAVLSPGTYIDHSGLSQPATNLRGNRAIPHPPRERNRTARHRRVRFSLPVARCIQLCGLRRSALHGKPQIQVRMRLACVL